MRRLLLILPLCLVCAACVISPEIERKYRPSMDANLQEREVATMEIQRLTIAIIATEAAIASGEISEPEGKEQINDLVAKRDAEHARLASLLAERDRLIAEAQAEAAEEGAAQLVAASDEVLGGLQVLAAIFGLQGAAGAIGVGRGLMRGLRKQPEGETP